MDDNNNPPQEIDVSSGNIGESSKKLYLYEGLIIIDENIIEFNDIKDIHMSVYNPIDWNVLGIIITNIIMSIAVSFIFELSIILSLFLIIGFILLGVIITTYIRNKIYSYISIKTGRMEYLIGIQNEEDMDTIYETISPHISEDITYEYFSSNK
jgi:hypothetical protein